MEDFKKVNIEITELKNPPFIYSDELQLKGIVSFKYIYETSDHESNGTNGFEIEYFDKEEQAVKTKKIYLKKEFY